MCNQLCQSFENSIKTTNVCDSSQNCISGCVSEIETSNSCPEGWMWRNKDTCVQKSDCTCYSRNGTLVKVRLLKITKTVIKKNIIIFIIMII